jgi:hypothetical protein
MPQQHQLQVFELKWTALAVGAAQFVQSLWLKKQPFLQALHSLGTRLNL